MFDNQKTGALPPWRDFPSVRLRDITELSHGVRAAGEIIIDVYTSGDGRSQPYGRQPFVLAKESVFATRAKRHANR